MSQADSGVPSSSTDEEAAETEPDIVSLEAAFDSAVDDLAEWQREEASEELNALRGMLPGLVGFTDTSKVRRMIGVFVPSDHVGVHEAARLAGRSPERIRQLCRPGDIGHFDSTKRRYLVSRRLLDEYNRWRPV